MYQELVFDIEDNIATITLNRPESMNALSLKLHDELHAALSESDANPAVRAVILTGAGRAFCSGFDMSSERPALDGTNVARYISDRYERDLLTSDRLLSLWRMSKPVIAAVNGWALGGGFWYQLACDITIASERAVFGQPEVRHMSNTTFLFAALCGWKAANRYALTGDHIDAHEALRIGLVTQVVKHEHLMEAARSLAARIALVPEASVRMNKAITMSGLMAAGVQAGMLVNVPYSALAHSSYGDRREALDRIRREEGLRGFLAARDQPFRPEPFGPRSGCQ